MVRVIARRPHTSAWIIGDGYLKEEIQRLVKLRGLEKSVEFHGFQTDLAGILRRLDLFVLSSSSEGLPIALLDAVATEIPFVCTSVGGIAELFTDGVHGRLVPPLQPELLAEGIIDTLKHYDQALSKAASARTRIAPLTIRAMIDQHARLYDELVSARQ